MDLKQLEAFLAIIEWGSFSEAAEKLYLTQPTVTGRIQALERSLNTELIDRSAKRITLTADGHRLQEYAKSMLRTRQRMLEEFSGRHSMPIRFGASSVPAACIVPELMSSYLSKEPSARFIVTQCDSQKIISQLQTGELDMGICGMRLNDDHFICETIYRDKMVLAAPYKSEYAELFNSGGIKQLIKEPYILRESGSGTRKETAAFLETIGTDESELNISVHADSLDMVRRCVVLGMGVSILSKKTVEDLEELKKIYTFDLSQDGVDRSYYLIRRKNGIKNTALRDFADFTCNFYNNV